jgi:anti-sigma B factor antagonist
MSFVMSKRGDVVVLNVGEQLALRSRDELKRAVMKEFNRGERKFLIDFEETGFVDSSGLGALIGISKKLHDLGGELSLVNLNDDLTCLFALTKLDTLFQIVRKQPAAVQSAPGLPRQPTAPVH